MSDYNLEDPGKVVEPPKEEVFRVIYRRRGSDLIFGATKDDAQVQVTRWNHRFKKGKSFLHTAADVDQNKESIKQQIESGGYKLVSGGPAEGIPQPEDK